MSEENVELIRRGWEHFRATGEIRAHPDLVWDVSGLGWPDQQVYDGVEGAHRFNAEWAAEWDDWQIDAEQFLDAGDRVVVIMNQRGRAKTSGIPADWRLAQIWSFRDGMAIRMEMYASVDAALEAAGLPPEERDAPHT